MQHKEATEKELVSEQSATDGGLRQLFQEQATLNKAAVKVAMECLYWLVKSEMPHTSLYGPMLEAVRFMGCNKLIHLHHGENSKYTSRRITQEFLHVMSGHIEEVQLRALLSSPYFSLMVDETTDISVMKEMVLYARFVSSTSSVTSYFLKIIELSDGRAETVEEAILAYLMEKSIPLSKLVGFGSDGAAVMIGRVSGVATRLKHKQPVLISIHCVAHRLALAAGQAGEKVPFLSTRFKPTLRQLFYFFENSAVRMSGLKSLEQILNLPELKLKKAADTRWLSHDTACHTLVRVLPAVVASVEREAAERGDALAVGLSKVVKQYNFVASLYLMCPMVSRLSRIFQLSTVDMSEIHKQVTSTLEGLQLLLHTDGEYLDRDLASSLASCGISSNRQHFKSSIQQPL